MHLSNSIIDPNIPSPPRIPFIRDYKRYGDESWRVELPKTRLVHGAHLGSRWDSDLLGTRHRYHHRCGTCVDWSCFAEGYRSRIALGMLCTAVLHL